MNRETCPACRGNKEAVHSHGSERGMSDKIASLESELRRLREREHLAKEWLRYHDLLEKENKSFAECGRLLPLLLNARDAFRSALFEARDGEKTK